jgi:alkanesulfonate monooxygenase SsuD/methylene tetrahydromethanopterin reductase-like flavin-dependent oxidoreductase (luciferase family)
MVRPTHAAIGPLMDVGIGLPNALADVRGRALVDWAVAADARDFSVLGTIGRIAFATHEELIAFAAAAAVTERVELMSTVMIGPARQPALLAKQAATLDHIAEGRFRLGLGVGGRPDDYAVMDRDFDERGPLFDAQLDALSAIWRGHPVAEVDTAVGPPPFTDGGPPVVLGGSAPRALRRVAERADAYLAPPAPAPAVAQLYETVREHADGVGRPAPRLLSARYFALGDDVDDEVRHNVSAYYAFGGAEFVDQVYAGVLRTPDAIDAALQELSEVGVEEVCLWPMAADLSQVHALADITL